MAEQATHRWVWFTKRGAEFDALAEIRDMGIEAHLPVSLRLEARGKNRRPKPVDEPILSRTVFALGSVEDWHSLRAAKHLSGTHLCVGPREWERHVARFIDDAAEAHANDLTRYRAGDMTQYDRGQELLVTLGPMAGQIVKFIDSVERAHDLFPKIRAEVEVMGRAVRAEFDPLNLKRA